MSKRGARLVAYVSAEEHLLDIYSPLARDEVGAIVGPATRTRRADADGVELNESARTHAPPYTDATQLQEQGVDMDPAVDSMLHVISDDSDIHSLISSHCCGSGGDFKGWEEQHSSLSIVTEGEPFIYGLRRRRIPSEDASAPPGWCCTPAKRARSSLEVIEINDSPEAVRDPAIVLLQTMANSPCLQLTNGTGDQFALVPHEDDADEFQVQAEVTQPCVIYETVDGDNMVVLEEEHCCEIIVATQGVASEQEFARAIMMSGNGAEALLGLLPGGRGPDQQLNGVTYIEEVTEDLEGDGTSVTAGNNVYLSDAAIEQPLVHQELVEDEAPEENENATFVDDTPMEEERPDICQVYDHELEDEDDDCIVQQPAAIPQLEKGEPPQNQLTHKLPREYSSPTEFPVSSSSMPNASFNYDYEDELLGGAIASKVTPLKRKYPPLMKNTLYAEAMDRRLASICQAQPQMSPAEKVSSWETAASDQYAAVEDVENFQAEFEQHEANPGPLRQHNFIEFRDTLARNLEKISRDIMHASEEYSHEQATSYLSRASRAERPLQRRLLHILPTEETIVLDEDDDCYEVVGMENASVTTLIPEEELEVVQQPDEEDPDIVPIASDLNTMETQHSTQMLLTKKTSTTDLVNFATAPTAIVSPPSSAQVANVPIDPLASAAAEDVLNVPESRSSDLVPAGDRQIANAVLDVMRHQVQIQHQNLMEPKMNTQERQGYCYQELSRAPQEISMQMEGDQRSAFANCPNDAIFYEQQEFCNYLGLTELATANAVATAMRELANSTVARRSLRVRPQQQLDRMRSDVRGKRRERERDRDQQQDKEKKQPLTTSSELSTDKEDTLPPQTTDLASEDGVALEQQRQSVHKCDYYHRTDNYGSLGSDELIQGNTPPTEQRQISKENSPIKQQVMCRSPNMQEQLMNRSPKMQEQLMIRSPKQLERSKELDVEAAFAKVYEAAAPAQSKLLESMQQRLRQARESKPSIYIIKATHNAPPQTQTPSPTQANFSPASPARLKVPTFGDVSVPYPSAVISTTTKTSIELGSPAKEPSYSSTRIEPKTQAPKAAKQEKTLVAPPNAAIPAKRRRTTVGAPALGKRAGRDLVTRSTTHLNSKLLRNRKVSLLKSYALTDELASGRSRRLSGGTAQGAKKVSMPKPMRAGLKRPDVVDKNLPQQHRLQQQQLVASTNQPKSKAQSKPGNTMPATGKRKEPIRQAKRTKRVRAKSLPATFEKNLVQPDVPIPTPIKLTQNFPKHPMDPRNAVVVEAIETHSTSPAQAPPVLIYPPSPTSLPLNDPKNAEERRLRQQAGNANLVGPEPIIRGTPPGGLLRLSEGSTTLPNPLNAKHGKVLYMYYELEQLIVLQESVITFWKYSKVFNVLHQQRPPNVMRKSPSQTSPSGNHYHSNNLKDTEVGMELGPRWVFLGRVRRISNDIEIFAPFGSRMCMHNSTPVYLEMRCRPLDHHKREVQLTSLHVNVYYFCEEELRPRMHSVHLDTVNCESSQVIYTGIAESRYFVMAWQQELVMGKPRSGICKYSLTPTLDTLASIREFKQLRHELRHIECLSEDRLIGYGQTRITVWDHRSGDTLMNYDLDRPLGRSLAAMHYPSLDLDQSSMLVLYQHIKEPAGPGEVHVIACELSHATPSHRLLQVHRLPSPQFDLAIEGVNTGDHLIIKSASEDEAWISAADPRQLTYVAPQSNGAQRFYARHKSQVIEMTPQSLTVDSIANHMLKLAVQHQRHT
ncbi:hypothetical protein KR009_001840, partial [Drosophila setifemur]